LNPTPQLWGSSMARFDNENDLVALRVPADQDRLSELILNYFGGFFKVCVSSACLYPGKDEITKTLRTVRIF
jgi:hypothetical protein